MALLRDAVSLADGNTPCSLVDMILGFDDPETVSRRVDLLLAAAAARVRGCAGVCGRTPPPARGLAWIDESECRGTASPVV
jgi:hypothetical protein